MKKTLILLVLLGVNFAFAKYEWPGFRAKEGQHCDHEMRPAYSCAEGLFCHRTDPADYWGGTCRRPCHRNADCKPGEYCAMVTNSFGACLRAE